MPWIARRSLLAARVNQRKYFRQSIELPIAISVSGLPAPVYATLIDISETGCRIRSLILVDRGRGVDFEFKRPNRASFALAGRIVTRSTPSRGGGFEYGIKFSATMLEERAKLGREILGMQRRDAAARAEKCRPPAALAFANSKQRRASVRALAAFPVRYRLANRSTVLADANDLSTGGLRVVTGGVFSIGTILELSFTLPGDYLGVYPPVGERTEISPFGPRVIRVPDNRRPFDEIRVHGRIVSRFVATHKRCVYGVKFTDIDGYQREEIARFTHAVQLTKLRTQ